MKAGWPVRAARHVLSRVLGRRDDALGDLDEELARRRAAGRGRWSSEIWYLGEGASLLLAAVRERMESTAGSDGGAGLALDVREGVRRLRSRPASTGLLAATIALAAGGTTTVFGLVSAGYLRPLPYAEGPRLARIYTAYGEGNGGGNPVAPLTWRDLQRRSDVLEAVGVWSVAETVHWVGSGEPMRLVAPRASAGLFDLSGLDPVVGRWPTPGDQVPGDDDVVVLSHGLWVRAFGSDPDVVGRRLVLDGRAHEVVGVADPAFRLPADADLWRPLALGPEWFTPDRRGWEFLAAVGRLAPDVTAAEAARRLSADLATRAPERVERFGQRVAVVPYRDALLGATGPALLYLLGAVGLVLTLACVNVMGVLLARAESRTRELAMRRALGAGGGRIVRGILAETVALAVAGGLPGLLLAVLALRTGHLAPEGLAVLGPPTVDARVLGFSLALVTGTALLFGLGPAWWALGTDPAGALREGGSRVRGSRWGSGLRGALVVAGVALALILLVGVGLSVRGFATLVDRDPGFRPEGVLTLTLEQPAGRTGHSERAAFYRSLLARLEALPGVEAAGLTNGLPLEGTVWSASFELVAPDPSVADVEAGGNMRSVSPGYFRALGIEVLEGRTFDDADDERGAPVVVVDRTLARRYWPGASPVGRRVVADVFSQQPATVVGVVEDVRDQGLHAPGSGHLYFPAYQRALRRTHVVVRSPRDPAALAGPVRAAVREADARIPVFGVRTFEDRLTEMLAAPRLAITGLLGFGVLGLLLAALGVYGVLSRSVARRRSEIGTRIALGARPSSATGHVVGEALRLWVAGTALGLGGAVVASRTLERLTGGIARADPVLYGAATAVLAVVAAAGALGPAWRAARLDPAEALRREG